jgi:hypothetical protein
MLSPSLVILPNDVRAASVALYDAAGNQLSGFDPSRPANAVIATVPTTTTSVVLLAANPARRQVFVSNEASKTLFLAFAATASATAYTLAIAGNQLAVLPMDGYTGVISVVLQGGSGSARVTEVTT